MAGVNFIFIATCDLSLFRIPSRLFEYPRPDDRRLEITSILFRIARVPTLSRRERKSRFSRVFTLAANLGRRISRARNARGFARKRAWKLARLKRRADSPVNDSSRVHVLERGDQLSGVEPRRALVQFTDRLLLNVRAQVTAGREFRHEIVYGATLQAERR